MTSCRREGLGGGSGCLVTGDIGHQRTVATGRFAALQIAVLNVVTLDG